MRTLTRISGGIAAALATALILAACGGGGSSGGSATGTPTMPDTPTTTHIGSPPDGATFNTAGSYRGLKVSTGSTPEGASAARVLEYLEVNASGGPWHAGAEYSYHAQPGIPSFREWPVIRIGASASSQFTSVVRRAVNAINERMPRDRQLRIGAPAPSGLTIHEIPDNEIFVESTPTSADWIVANPDFRPGARGISTGEVERETGTVDGRTGYGYTRAGRVWHAADADPESWFRVVLHELVHALGFRGHLPQDRFPDSVLRDQYLLLATDLPAIDGDAIHALYSRFPVGPQPDEISATSLGRWDDTRFHLQGEHDTAGISFGASTRNGIADAWASGHRPVTDLSENTMLTGDVVWNGALLGFTPADRTVAGDAAITIDLATLDGDATFTELESWGVRTAPGTPGSGTQWLDGDLAYAIDVIGNRFRETGGDAGDLDGMFVGTGHEGAVGTLERDDLTAAFGATR